MMSIGYACLTIGVPKTDFNNCIIKNASDDKLKALIAHNLDSLENIIDYNTKNTICLFRISSDLIPFGSNPANNLRWWELFDARLQTIGRKIISGGIRVSMHPGQYTVLNSPEKLVVMRAIEDLMYHARLLDSLGLGSEHKIILHIGGVYGNKTAAIDCFTKHYGDLDDKIKRRLVIENDDKSYHIGDVLEIGAKLQIPVVYDNLHNAVNCCDRTKHDADWIAECKKTWQEKDGPQKIHYSQQNPLKKAGSHSETIFITQFMAFYESLGAYKPDIMLEVKDKNLSAVKCINCTTPHQKTSTLEAEWSRYKYKILENAPQIYQQIRKLLQDKDRYPAVEFYELVEQAMQNEPAPGNRLNAALHVWGYFKSAATEQEKAVFMKTIDAYKDGTVSIARIKRLLWKMVTQYEQDYLSASYYFI